MRTSVDRVGSARTAWYVATAALPPQPGAMNSMKCRPSAVDVPAEHRRPRSDRKVYVPRRRCEHEVRRRRGEGPVALLGRRAARARGARVADVAPVDRRTPSTRRRPADLERDAVAWMSHPGDSSSSRIRTLAAPSSLWMTVAYGSRPVVVRPPGPTRRVRALGRAKMMSGVVTRTVPPRTRSSLDDRARACRGPSRWRRRTPSASSDATAMNSAGTAEPSRCCRLIRPRSSCDGALAVVQSISATSRDDSWTIAPKCWPRSSSGRKPVSRSHGIRQEREARLGIDRPDEVRGVLDEVAIALLRLAQLAFQPLALADVADRALGADPAAVLEHAGRRDLGRERRAVALDEDEAARARRGRGPATAGTARRDRHRLGLGQEGEVLADDLLDRPAEQGLARVGHEREAPSVSARQMTSGVVWTRPRKRASSRVTGEQVRVGERDGGLVGQALEQVELVGLEDARLRGRDGERADDLAAGRAQRRRGHPRSPRRATTSSSGSCGMRGSAR